MRWRAAACSLVALVVTMPVHGRQSRTGWFDLPVQGGAATLASLGIPVEERALALPLMARALHDRETRFSKAPRLVIDILNATATPAVGADTERESIDIPAPLDADTWRQLLDLPGDADLFARFLIDRNALLLASALAATDDSIRQHVARDRDLLRFLYREGAPALQLVARSLSIDDRRVVVPGADEGPAIWEPLAGVPPSRVTPFIRALLARDQGRLAWYFDTIAQMDEPRLAAVWPRGAAGRVASARALYDVFRDSDPPWRPSDQPFRRSIGDAWSVVTLSDVADGQLSGPSPAAFWRVVFGSDGIEVTDAARQITRDPAGLPLPALVREIVMESPRERRQRFEMFRLTQRVFAGAAPESLATVAVAINGYKRFPSLLLALERMAITNAETWAAMVAAARHVTDESDQTEASIVSFQGAVAIVERLAHRRTIEAATTTRLMQSLGVAVRSDRKVSASIARWLTDTLVPALPPLEKPDALSGRTAYESRVLQALAGPRGEGKAASLDWEGLPYTVDLAAAEHTRLLGVRRLIPSPGLDAALVSKNPKDLAGALTTIVYSVALGQPDGAVALSRDVGTRHDFGFNATAMLQRITPWAPPEERQGDGPWHIVGSLIGLDRGLSRLALRRVADEQMPLAPVLTLNDFATLARTIVAMVPTALQDADRDAIAVAIGRGRQRVLDVQQRPDALLALATRVRMSAATRQVLPWIAAHDPHAIVGSFSLRDLLWLGEPAVPAGVLDRWGVDGHALDGRPITMMPPPAPWEDFAGRPDAGQMTTQVPDLTLRLVEETARLRLPAAIVPALLAYAVEDFWHDAQARFADDWPRMTRQAAALDGTRVEDYVAALVGDGVLRPQ